MNDALIAAQQLRAEAKQAAEREAEAVIREARAEGERIVDRARMDERQVRERAETRSPAVRGLCGGIPRAARTADGGARRARGSHEDDHPGAVGSARCLDGDRGIMTTAATHARCADGRRRWRRSAGALPFVPEVGIILGTGLGGAGQRASTVEAEIPYAEIPGFPAQHGRVPCGQAAARHACGAPRRGDAGTLSSLRGLQPAAGDLPGAGAAARSGASTLVVSGAVGGMHPLWNPGDLALLSDHINLMGDNPLIGPNDDRLGPRFPDMSAPYDAALRATAHKAALELGHHAARGRLRGGDGSRRSRPGPSTGCCAPSAPTWSACPRCRR